LEASQDAAKLLRDGRVSDALRLLEARAASDAAAAVSLREYYIGEAQPELAMPHIQRLANEHGAEAQVSRSIHALLGGDVQAAAQACEAALRMDPDLATAHNHLGRALHNLGRSADAIRSFECAIGLDPKYAQAWHNLGHVQRAAGRLAEAVHAYQQALALAPGFRAARLNLGITHILLDDPAAALASLEPMLEDRPEHVEALANTGLALHMLGRLEDARRHLERAVDIDRGHANAWCYLGILLNEHVDSDGARRALETALRLNPRDADARAELAGVFEQSNRLDEARRVVAAGRQYDPYHPGLKLEAAKLERRAGNVTAAIELLRSIQPAQLPARPAQQYYFELGQALDRNGDWEEAYSAFRSGNELAAHSPRRAGIDPQGFGRRCKAITGWLAEGAPGIRPGPGETDGDTGADLCFLLGFPRSGTTLLDTFLGAHPAVCTIEEKPTLERVMESLRQHGPGYPQALRTLSAEHVAALRGRYRQELEWHAGPARSGASLFLDKLPMRTLNLGLIQRLFPGARVLFALRHPCDVVLSNFMQSYADNEAFIHFDTLEASAAMYDQVMNLWLQYQPHLALRLLQTRYEDLVADSRRQLGQICDFLGLEPSEGMLDLETRLAERQRIRTNSYQQVAEDIYTRSAGRWKHYQGHFSEVLPRLQGYIEAFGYGA
jgi:Flp pilus assembly protein TadD